MINAKKYHAFEILIYFILLFLAFILQTSNIYSVYNLPSASLVLALVLVVSFFENYWFSSLFGLASGIIIDTVTVGGSGFHALVYMLTGFICSLILEVFLQNNFASFAVVSAPMIIFHMFIEIIYNSGFTTGIFNLFFKFHLLVAIYTFSVSFIIYLFFYFIIKKDERFKKPKGIIKNNK